MTKILIENINSAFNENPKRIQVKQELEDFLSNVEKSEYIKKIDELSDTFKESDKTKEFYAKFVLNLYDTGQIFFVFT